MFARLLSWLFPPVLPGRVRDWHERIDPVQREEGWAGNVRRRYRDGIDRYFSENPPPTIRWGSPEYRAQLREAEQAMLACERDLISQGYVNTIHDCWEPNEDYGPLQRLALTGPPKK